MQVEQQVVTVDSGQTGRLTERYSINRDDKWGKLESLLKSGLSKIATNSLALFPVRSRRLDA